MRDSNFRKGFTLIEIIFVITLLGLLTALALPNLFRVRNNAKEGLVKAALRTFSVANESYRANQVSPMYAASITDLANGPAPYLDPTWPGESRHDFNMAYNSTAVAYAMIAIPLSNSPMPYFCIDQSGTLFTSAAAIGASGGCNGGSPVTA